MEIWPAIDLRGGKCVRLRQGDFALETEYGDDPVAVAARWVAEGATRLHLVDLDGARQGRPVHEEIVACIVERFSITCQLGGGIRDESGIERWIERGVERLVVGTRAVEDPEWFAQVARRFPGRLVFGLDARGDRTAVSGWERAVEGKPTDWIERFASLPLAGVVYTDISRDGMMQGPNVEATGAMVAASPWPVIASGGVTRIEDISQLAACGAAGCIIGRALYEGEIELARAIELASEVTKAGSP